MTGITPSSAPISRHARIMFWLLPFFTAFSLMLLALLLYTAACAIHYLYHLYH